MDSAAAPSRATRRPRVWHWYYGSLKADPAWQERQKEYRRRPEVRARAHEAYLRRKARKEEEAAAAEATTDR
jgi:hypothetical protein